MKRKNISLDNVNRIINWEIAHCKKECDGGDPKVIHELQAGMKILWFDFGAYQKGQDSLIKGPINAIKKHTKVMKF